MAALLLLLRLVVELIVVELIVVVVCLGANVVARVCVARFVFILRGGAALVPVSTSAAPDADALARPPHPRRSRYQRPPHSVRSVQNASSEQPRAGGEW